MHKWRVNMKKLIALLMICGLMIPPAYAGDSTYETKFTGIGYEGNGEPDGGEVLFMGTEF